MIYAIRSVYSHSHVSYGKKSKSSLNAKDEANLYMDIYTIDIYPDYGRVDKVLSTTLMLDFKVEILRAQNLHLSYLPYSDVGFL
jgi:hypothetical protein